MPVLLAAMLLVLIGMTGLAVDFGFGTLERRVLQNAVDAAAVTGASDLARSITPVNDVQSMATRNQAAPTTTVVCEYVDNANAVTGPCGSAPSGTTSGVRVTATNLRATYFMRVLGVPTITVSAASTARVSTWADSSSTPAGGAPYNLWGSFFMVCGYNTRLAPNGNGNGNAFGNAQNILDPSTPPTGPGPWNVLQAAIGQEYVIHDSNPNHLANCGITDGEFKGLNSSAGMFSLPTWIRDESGNRAGPVTDAIKTYAGCPSLGDVGSASLNNCVMIIPIFSTVNAKARGDWDVYAVRWLPFLIRRIDANTHYGTLLDCITLQDTSTLLAPWTKNTHGSITVVRTVQ